MATTTPLARSIAVPTFASWILESRSTADDQHHYGNIHGAIYGFASVSLAVTTITTALRLYTKFGIFKLHRIDDILMIFAWAGLVCMWTFLLYSVRFGAGNRISDISPSEVPGGLKYAFLHELFYAIVQCLLKTSIALQILHIFVPQKKPYRNKSFWVITIFIVLQNIWFIIFFWISLFQCDPIRREFDPEVPGHCLSGTDEYNITVSTWNMASDILMLVFPMFCIAGLNMQKRLKIEAGSIFFVGALAVVSSMLRLIFTIRRLYTSDTTLVLTQIALCDAGEITAGILVGNFVPLPRLIHEIIAKIRRRTGHEQKNFQHLGPEPATPRPRSALEAVQGYVRSSSSIPIDSSRGATDTGVTAASSDIFSFEELVSTARVQRDSRLVMQRDSRGQRESQMVQRDGRVCSDMSS